MIKTRHKNNLNIHRRANKNTMCQMITTRSVPLDLHLFERGVNINLQWRQEMSG